MKLLQTIVLIAALDLYTRAFAQNDPQKALEQPPSACLEAKTVQSRDLYGLWHATLGAAARVNSGTAAKAPVEADVTFARHAEEPGALSGHIVRRDATGGSTTSVLAGGIGDGEFGIEESADGRSISGLWNGEVVPGSCGREIRGTFIDPADDSERGFVLRRKGGTW